MDIVKIIIEYCQEISEYLKTKIQKKKATAESIFEHVDLIQEKMFIALQMYNKFVSNEIEKKEIFSKILNILADFFVKEICDKYKLETKVLREMPLFRYLLSHNVDPQLCEDDEGSSALKLLGKKSFSLREKKEVLADKKYSLSNCMLFRRSIDLNIKSEMINTFVTGLDESQAKELQEHFFHEFAATLEEMVKRKENAVNFFKKYDQFPDIIKNYAKTAKTKFAMGLSSDKGEIKPYLLNLLEVIIITYLNLPRKKSTDPIDIIEMLIERGFGSDAALYWVFSIGDKMTNATEMIIDLLLIKGGCNPFGKIFEPPYTTTPFKDLWLGQRSVKEIEILAMKIINYKNINQWIQNGELLEHLLSLKADINKFSGAMLKKQIDYFDENNIESSKRKEIFNAILMKNKDYASKLLLMLIDANESKLLAVVLNILNDIDKSIIVSDEIEATFSDLDDFPEERCALLKNFMGKNIKLSLMSRAAFQGHYQVVDVLYQHNFSINCIDDEEMPPLISAIFYHTTATSKESDQRNALKMIDFFLDRGVAIHEVEKINNMGPLFYALHTLDEHRIKRILNHPHNEIDRMHKSVLIAQPLGEEHYKTQVSKVIDYEATLLEVVMNNRRNEFGLISFILEKLAFVDISVLMSPITTHLLRADKESYRIINLILQCYQLLEDKQLAFPLPDILSTAYFVLVAHFIAVNKDPDLVKLRESSFIELFKEKFKHDSKMNIIPMRDDSRKKKPGFGSYIYRDNKCQDDKFFVEHKNLVIGTAEKFADFVTTPFLRIPIIEQGTIIELCPLIIVIIANELKLLEIIASKIESDQIQKNKDECKNALRLAISCGNQEAVEFLLKQGFGSLYNDEDYFVPLLDAIKRDNVDAIKLILEFAKTEQSISEKTLFTINKLGLKLAAEKNTVDILKLLVQYIDRNHPETTSQLNTILQKAVGEDRNFIVNYIAEILPELENRSESYQKISDSLVNDDDLDKAVISSEEADSDICLSIKNSGYDSLVLFKKDVRKQLTEEEEDKLFTQIKDSGTTKAKYVAGNPKYSNPIYHAGGIYKFRAFSPGSKAGDKRVILCKPKEDLLCKALDKDGGENDRKVDYIAVLRPKHGR